MPYQPGDNRRNRDEHGLQKIRRTAASEMERVAPNLAEEFLQHAPRDVTHRSYLNLLEPLREALDRMAVPAGYKAGPKMAERQEAKLREERATIHQSDFVVPLGPNSADWQFWFGRYRFRGRWYPISPGVHWSLLRELALSTEPVGWQRLVEVAREAAPRTKMATQSRIAIALAYLRKRLRSHLGLANEIDPIPCVQRRPAAWWLWIPPA